jgi:energy-coupling factor transporter transmembrane protein EcfT
MDKKGSVSLTVIAGAIIAIVLLLIFIIPKFRIFLIGFAFIIAGILIATKGEQLTRNKAIFSLLFIAIGILVIIFQGFIQQTAYGFTTLSVSDANMVDGGSRIRVYGVANGAEALQISFSPSNVNPYIKSEGYEATKTVIGSMGMLNPTRDFSAMKDYNKNFIKVGYYELSLLKSCENNRPSGLSASTPVYRVYLTGICVYEDYIGTYSPFTGTVVDNTKVLFQIGTASGTISPSEGQNTLTLNDGKTKVEWTGNLMNYKSLESPKGTWALLFNSNTNTYSKMIDDSAWNTYYTLQQTYGLNNGLSIFASKQKTKEYIDGFNVKVDNILTDKTSSYKANVPIDSFEYLSNGIRVGLTEASVFPTFIMTLDATSLGIIELKGTPDITTCVPNAEKFSGDTYNSQVTVKNIGRADGNFIGSISCTGNSGVTGTAGTNFVQMGLTGTIPISVTGTNDISGTQSNTCKVTVTDQKGGGSDTCSFTLGVKHQEVIKCEANKIECIDAKTLKVCNNDGSDFTLNTCQYGCGISAETGLAYCKSQEVICGDGFCDANGGETNITCEKDCKDYIPCEEKTPAWLGWEQTVTTKQTIWSRIGIARPRTETYCKATNAPYVFGGIVVLLLGLSALLIIPKKKTTGKTTKFGKIGK